MVHRTGVCNSVSFVEYGLYLNFVVVIGHQRRCWKVALYNKGIVINAVAAMIAFVEWVSQIKSHYIYIWIMLDKIKVFVVVHFEVTVRGYQSQFCNLAVSAYCNEAMHQILPYVF